VPAAWYEQLGQLSRHQMIDAEISQIAYLLDMIEIVAIDVTHNQAELAQNTTEVIKPKHRFEGNPKDVQDFHYPPTIEQRHADCDRLCAYMKSLGQDASFWQGVKDKTRDPWERLKANDINHHMFRFDMAYDGQNITSITHPDES
jgi:hypothetical protein